VNNRTHFLLRACAAMVCTATLMHAQAGKPSPRSKLYVADLSGDTEIDTGKEIDDLSKKAVYNAEGASIETKSNSNASVVLSNGTGVFFDVSTHVKFTTFKQEAFKPSRSDLDDEPSVSLTRVFVDYGVVGISTSNQAPGSTMVYETSLATASIRGRQAVIVAKENLTVISMVQGEATVQAGPLDRPHLVKNHQQIIIRPGKQDEQNIVEIQDIPDGSIEDDMAWLEERVLTADAARKLVYFEVQPLKQNITVFSGGGTTTVAGASSGGGSTSSVSGSDSDSEIVAVPVVPANPPVQPVVSPANLTNG
jgi:hypothetical protein